MSLENVPRCQHVKVNGTQCGSPALRRRRRCYFHEEMCTERAKDLSDQFGQRRFVMPVLEDANAVQIALMKVMQMLVRGQIDTKVAGLLLYGLQTASGNLRHTTFQAEKATDVVIDRDTVDQTCINGPQWFARDFADEVLADAVEVDEAQENEVQESEVRESEVQESEVQESEVQESEVQEGEVQENEQRVAVAAGGERATSAAAAQSCRPGKLGAGKLRTDKRKRPEAAGVEEAPTWAQNILRRIEAARDGVEPVLIKSTG
jgi:hypothetical protein